GGVEVDVSVIYQVPEDRPATGVDLDGYRADIDTGDDAMGDCPRSDARSAIVVTATPPTNATQPGDIWLFACFGPHASAARQQFLNLAHTVKVRSRPAESVPVAGAQICNRAELRLSPVPTEAPGSQQFAFGYKATNIGRDTCSIDGYPNVVLSSKNRSPLSLVYETTKFFGPPHKLYLRPGSSAEFELDTGVCQQGPRIAASTVRITLPATSSPFVLNMSHTYSSFCDDPRHPQTIGVRPLHGV
ncbi:DUF4232 domain-containing protein, partial [Jatrophihabitans sp.]|uniref:DUF4232 domain-containing protein n=1 Tax=Jatrophihabitans sp. TaxID=1932789 RepID=UPI0030C71591|nr:hypothetical protein [Jatrophihabitans sp.]